MTEELDDVEDIKQETKKFIEGKEEAMTVLKRALKYERDCEDEDCTFNDRRGHSRGCWEPGDDVAMAPYYMGALKSAPFVNVLVDTNNHTLMSLEDWQAVYDAIDEKEDEPEKFSDEWANESVQNNNETLSDILENVEVSEDDFKKIKNIVEKNDALGYWSEYVAPQVKYRERAKKAVLIMLASPEDKNGNKGRINLFMYGEPGTGKSLFKNFLKDEFGAETIDGPRASKADLTFNKSKEEFGKLPNAHKGLLVVEEADEMGEGELGATLTSLGESGRIEIRDMEIPAEVRGIMLANFESENEIKREWSPESLNRFEFTIHFEKMDQEQKADTLSWQYENFRKPNPDRGKRLLKKYIKMARRYEPKIDQSEEIKDFMERKVDKIHNVREGISIMNVAWTIARLNFEDVKLSHYKKAFELVTKEQDSNGSLSDKFGS